MDLTNVRLVPPSGHSKLSTNKSRNCKNGLNEFKLFKKKVAENISSEFKEYGSTCLNRIGSKATQIL